MNKAVIYCSKTGHSKKIAQAVADELHVHAENVKENPDIGEVDWLFIVGGVYGGASDSQLIEYVSQLDGDKVHNAVLMTSCLSQKMKQDKIREILVEKGVNVHDDEFLCKGNFLFFGLGHPNQGEIRAAARFVKDLMHELEVQKV